MADLDPALTVRGLRVAYGPIHAVRGIDLDVASGELVALVGPNGAGKTSTLAAIAGLTRAQGGTIEFGGRSVAGVAPEDIIRAGIALVPESRNIFASLSVEENLRLGITIRRDRAAAASDVEAQLDRMPILRQRLRQAAGLLSGGEQQQLAIARALVSRPKLLLLDEPSLGLAPRMVDLVFEIVAELREQGTTVLLVEQNASRAVALADRAYVLRTGRVVRSGSSADVLASGALTDDYLGADSDDPAFATEASRP
ncbi:ABC transporter ATP-binding protein [Desertimonas flava]|uniref:ABC transporter ATP-binding protein n=1 Tax=Desertimonas flava TaxID=2064846 RepID=UPI000E345BF2|nr:ABC transporter ATP-binding protein [Desertimonas flava]